MRTLHHPNFAAITACALLVCAFGFAGAAAGQQLPVVDAVMKYEDVTIVNIMAPPALAPALKEGKVDAVV
jgi:hypothetical protein